MCEICVEDHPIPPEQIVYSYRNASIGSRVAAFLAG